jgi:hypothetical protein
MTIFMIVSIMAKLSLYWLYVDILFSIIYEVDKRPFQMDIPGGMSRSLPAVCLLRSDRVH